MKKVNSTIEVVNAMNESKKTKGFKSVNAENANQIKPKLSEVKNNFISFIKSKEEIGLNKFFKLFAEFKNDCPNMYADFLSVNNLDFSVNYDFSWFAKNCPSIEIDGKKEFARWAKVTEKNPKNENDKYNREINGVLQTLKPYYCTRANYEQYLSMLLDVIREQKRIKRAKEKAKKEQEKAESKALQIEKLQKELAKLMSA